MDLLMRLVIYISFVFMMSGCAFLNPSALEAKEQGLPIKISSFYPEAPNSAGGVSVRINYYTFSEDPIKYIVFTVTPYNSVGDTVYSEIGNRSTYRLSTTGPYYNSNNRKDVGWSNIWYNTTIRCIEIESIEVTYMNDTVESFIKPDFKNVVSPSMNSCKFKDKRNNNKTTPTKTSSDNLTFTNPATQ